MNGRPYFVAGEHCGSRRYTLRLRIPRRRSRIRKWFKGGLDSGSLSAVGLRRTVLAATKTALTHEESSAVQSLAVLKLWCDEFDSIYLWRYCAESMFPGGELGIRRMRSTGHPPL